jgi:glycosyltransferase involved in cell wall biosynthesis
MSHQLANLDLVIFANDLGPSSRRTTIANALAHGVPVIAFDGAERWDRFSQADAIAVVRPEPKDLTTALDCLLQSADRRADLGERGRQLYEAHMSLATVAQQLLEVFDSVRR